MADDPPEQSLPCRDLFGELLEIVVAAQHAKERSNELERRIEFINELQARIVEEARNVHQIAENLVSTAKATSNLVVKICDIDNWSYVFQSSQTYSEKISFADFANILGLSASRDERITPNNYEQHQDSDRMACLTKRSQPFLETSRFWKQTLLKKQTSENNEPSVKTKLPESSRKLSSSENVSRIPSLPLVWEENVESQQNGVPASWIEQKQKYKMQMKYLSREYARCCMYKSNERKTSDNDGENTDSEVEELMKKSGAAQLETKHKSPVEELKSEERQVDNNVNIKDVSNSRTRSLSPRDRSRISRDMSPANHHRRAASPLLAKEEQELIEVSSGESINSYRVKQRIKIPSRASSPSPARSNSSNLATTPATSNTAVNAGGNLKTKSNTTLPNAKFRMEKNNCISKSNTTSPTKNKIEDNPLQVIKSGKKVERDLLINKTKHEKNYSKTVLSEESDSEHDNVDCSQSSNHDGGKTAKIKNNNVSDSQKKENDDNTSNPVTNKTPGNDSALSELYSMDVLAGVASYYPAVENEKSNVLANESKFQESDNATSADKDIESLDADKITSLSNKQSEKSQSCQTLPEEKNMTTATTNTEATETKPKPSESEPLRNTSSTSSFKAALQIFEKSPEQTQNDEHNTKTVNKKMIGSRSSLEFYK